MWINLFFFENHPLVKPIYSASKMYPRTSQNSRFRLLFTKFIFLWAILGITCARRGFAKFFQVTYAKTNRWLFVIQEVANDPQKVGDPWIKGMSVPWCSSSSCLSDSALQNGRNTSWLPAMLQHAYIWHKIPTAVCKVAIQNYSTALHVRWAGLKLITEFLNFKKLCQKNIHSQKIFMHCSSIIASAN